MSGGCSYGPADPPLPRVVHLIPSLSCSIRKMDTTAQQAVRARSSAWRAGRPTPARRRCGSGARRSCASTWSPRTRHDFDTTIGTFEHPRYELVATGDVYDGEDEVRAVLRREPRGLPRPAQRADRAPPRRRRRDRRVRPARHPSRAAARAAADRPRVPLPHDRAVHLRGRPASWASASTSTSHDPAPARARALADLAGGPLEPAAVAPADDRARRAERPPRLRLTGRVLLALQGAPHALHGPAPRGRLPPPAAPDARDIHFRFPGDSTWATEIRSRDDLERWLQRFVAAGLQIYPREVVAAGAAVEHDAVHPRRQSTSTPRTGGCTRTGT